MVHLCDISCSPRKVMCYLIFTLNCTLTTNTVIFFALCVEQGARCRTSWGNAHPSKAKSILVPWGPNCLLQGAKALWSSVGFEGKAVPTRAAISRGVGTLGSDVQWHSGTWPAWTPLALKHPRIFELLSQQVWEECSSFLCNSMDSLFVLFFLCRLNKLCFFCCLGVLPFSLYTYIQKYFPEQLSFFSTALPVIHPQKSHNMNGKELS